MATELPVSAVRKTPQALTDLASRRERITENTPPVAIALVPAIADKVGRERETLLLGGAGACQDRRDFPMRPNALVAYLTRGAELQVR